jgi:hypothetical protein
LNERFDDSCTISMVNDEQVMNAVEKNISVKKLGMLFDDCYICSNHPLGMCLVFYGMNHIYNKVYY